MAIDHSLAMRKAIVRKLREAPPIIALVGERVYGEESPSQPGWPFIRYGLPSTASYEASCWEGSDHSITVHAFAKGPSIDNAAKLAGAIVAELDDADLPLIGIGIAGISWQNTQIIRDTDEASTYHAIIRFTAITFEKS